MGLKYLYDTNIYINFLSGILKEDYLFSYDFLSENDILISSIVRMEFLSHPNIKPQDESFFRELIRQFKIIPIDFMIEDEAIQIRKQYKLKLPDAIIAATAIFEDATLVTYDKKDFQRVKELKLYR